MRIAIFLFLTFSLYGRPSSYPYLSGDTFRAFCDYVYDETGNTVKPDLVQYGETIFLKTDYLREFFTSIHPHIASPYVLVTHNGDNPVPREFGWVLDDEKLLAWFGQNVKDYEHPKLHPVPIGIANRCWPHGNIAIFSEVQKQSFKRDILLYMNFSCGTNPAVRKPVFHLFLHKPFCFHAEMKDLKPYLQDLSRSQFVLSPEGNGLDCHRTWEALLMGAVPIVTHSSLDPLFEDLPVVVIDRWKEVTEGFLKAKWKEIRNREFHLEKLYADYWFQRINSFANTELGEDRGENVLGDISSDDFSKGI